MVDDWTSIIRIENVEGITIPSPSMHACSDHVRSGHQVFSPGKYLDLPCCDHRPGHMRIVNCSTLKWVVKPLISIDPLSFFFNLHI